MNNFIKLFCFAAAILFTFSGCRKLEDYNTIIEVVVPEDCKCAQLYYDFTMWEKPDKGWSDNPRPLKRICRSEGKVQEIEIDWDQELSEPENRDFKFFLDDSEKDNKNNFIPEEDWTTGEVSIRPSLVYRWDPEAGTFEKTGEKTDRKGDGGSSSGSSSSYWAKHNQTGYIYLSGSKAFFCQASNGAEYTGSYNASAKTIDVNLNGTQAHFEVTISGSTMILNQEFSSGHSAETVYYSSSESAYPCD